MEYIIYKFTNTINSKSYVGLTTQTLKRRVYLHFWKANKKPVCHFHRALNKYPKDVWCISILEDGDAPDHEHIKQRERYFICEHRTYIEGYNSTEGGEDFSSSDYQRQLQLDRVRNGTHPFLGGSIQSASMKRRHAAGEFIGQNQKRISEGNHHFVGNTNPQKKLAAEGKHHNQQNPWKNTKATHAWKIADQLYDWYIDNHQKKRGGSYRAMERAFNLDVSIQKMYYEYFQKGWNPRSDIDWIEFARS